MTQEQGMESRPLSERERGIVMGMIDAADVNEPTRDALRQQAETLRAYEQCACGYCPSVELAPSQVWRPRRGVERLVLQASSDRALILLFIDAGIINYLELAPLEDELKILEFPPVDEVTFGP